MAENKKKKTKFKANIFIWWFYTIVSKIYLLFKGSLKTKNKVFKKRNKKEGCLVLYNHTSNKDHFITTAAFNYTRVNYVITKHFYFNKTLRPILQVVKTIPRDQFKSDLLSIKNIKKAIDNKGVVAIAPAGQITIHGDMLYIDRAIVKLVRLCKCDVYSLRIYGGYLAFPKWRQTKRRFPVSTEFVKVFSKDEIALLTDDEIYNRVVLSIDVKDRNMQLEKPRKIKGKNIIKGLDNVLYYCPNCKSKYTTTTDGNIMTCSKCNNKVRMNEYGFLEPVGTETVMFENEYEWYKYQKDLIKKEIVSGSYHLEGKYELYRETNEEWKIEKVGEGKLVLTNDEFYYEGTINGEEVVKKFALDHLLQLPFDVAKRFDVPDDDGKFEFRPLENNKQVMEFVQAIDAMREIRIGH